MKHITKEIKQQMLLFESIEERVQYLKDKYSNETAYIVTCGPSLSSHDVSKLKEKLKDKLVISIKQAQHLLEEETDFHILNTYNLASYQWNSDSIVYWSVSKSYANEQLDRIVNMNAPIDLFIPVVNPPYLTESQTTQSTCNFDDFYMMQTHTEVKWGRGMMYEMALPLALLLGCKKIVIIGWDLGNPETSTTDWNHFYNINLGKVTGPAPGEIAQKIASTDKLYDWFVKKGVDVKIISDQSFVSSKFSRIEL